MLYILFKEIVFLLIVIISYVLLYRQLDVFDGAGSGDGIDGNLRTSSQQMLVIFRKLMYPQIDFSIISNQLYITS